MQSVDKRTDFDGTLGEVPINHDSEIAVDRILSLAKESDDIAGFTAAFGKESARFTKSLQDKVRYVKQDREFSLNQVAGFSQDVRQQAQAELDSVLTAGNLGLDILQEKDRVKQQKFNNEFKIDQFKAQQEKELLGYRFDALVDGVQNAFDLDRDEIIQAYQDQGITPGDAEAKRKNENSLALLKAKNDIEQDENDPVILTGAQEVVVDNGQQVFLPAKDLRESDLEAIGVGVFDDQFDKYLHKFGTSFLSGDDLINFKADVRLKIAEKINGYNDLDVSDRVQADRYLNTLISDLVRIQIEGIKEDDDGGSEVG